MPAGNIVAVGNLESIVFKTATLSNLNVCPSFTPGSVGAVNLI